MSRYVVALGIVLIAMLVFVGCGAITAPTPAGAPAKSVAPMATPIPAPAAPPMLGRAAVEESKPATDLETPAINVTDRLIIRNGSITLIVKNVTDTIGAITDLANASGGYVLRTDSRHTNGGELIATMTIKVPAKAFDETMAKLRKLAVKVDAESSSSQDVTEEYVDLEARLKVYEATEQQLLKFLDRTQNVDEALKVYRELNNVRSQIESLKGRMTYLERSAAMSTITIQVRPEEKPKPIVEENGWKPLRVMQDALRSLVRALQILANALIYFVLFLIPILILVAIPLLILRALWRRWKPQRAK